MADDSASAMEDTTTTTEDQQQDTSQSEDTKQELSPEVKAAVALRKANKEAESLRRKLKEYEDRDKTEAERLADAKAAAERDAADARMAYLRLKVGTAKGLDPEVADRLRGTDEKEMAADADRLLAVIGQRSSRGSADGGPRGGADTANDMNTRLRMAAGRT